MALNFSNYSVANQPGGDSYRRVEFNSSHYPVYSLAQEVNNESELQIVGKTNPLSVNLSQEANPGGYGSPPPEPVGFNNPLWTRITWGDEWETGTDGLVSYDRPLPIQLLHLDSSFNFSPVSSETPIPVKQVTPTVIAEESIEFTSTSGEPIFGPEPDRTSFIINNRGPGTLYLHFTTGGSSPTTDNYIVALEPNETYKDATKQTGFIMGIFGSPGTARCQQFIAPSGSGPGGGPVES